MAVSVSKGVLSPLLAKLTTLMHHEFKKLKRVRKQVLFLKDELSNMNAFLETLELIDELDPLAKDWRSHVREMAYDIEDCIDDFMHHLGDENPTEGFINKTMRRLKTVRHRHRIAHQMDELKTRVLEASERRTRYMLNERVSNNSGLVAVDPRVSALYTDANKLVGIDGPRKELVEWLVVDTQQQLKVVSVVGFGGLGKTTLAKEVYHNIRENFKCTAFVCVSLRPDMIRLLNDIRSKLGIKRFPPTREVQDNIGGIREHLKHRRYLIVVDDLWDAQAWDIISCAFPENDNGSRIIVTTRVEDVASRACGSHHECIYRMKPLNSQNSKRLFFSRIFGCEDGCPSQFEGISSEILKKCGGLPLAIITIASLLASRPTRLIKEWQNILNSLSMQIGTNPTTGGVRQILDLSYKNLPHDLRSCFLYLGIYPEDYVIGRDDLIREWVAEGLVSHGQNSYDVARSYFNELINRSLIQPQRTYLGEVLSCKVHDMMLDLILHRCEEDNFITVVWNSEETIRQQDKMVRRISLSFNSEKFSDDDSIIDLDHIVAVDAGKPGTFANSLSHVRSLAMFGKFKCVHLSMFKYLRMLIIDIRLKNAKLDLTDITQLFQLRYLKIVQPGYGYSELMQLPDKIKGLRHLETLEIKGWSPVSIPSDIIYLHHLSHLIVPWWEPTDALDNMKSLHTLEGLVLDDHELKIRSLGELRELRKLKLFVTYRGIISDKLLIDAIVSSLGKLRNLRYLRVGYLGFMSRCYIDDGVYNGLDSLANPPIHLEQLLLSAWKLPRVPRWINGNNLKNLSRLDLDIEETSTEEVRVLGELPSLMDLTLCVTDKPYYRRRHRPLIMFGPWSFPALEELYLHYGDDATSLVRFEAPGVLPNLRRLTLDLWALDWGGAAPVGMEHLLKLQDIHLAEHYWENDESSGDSEMVTFFRNYAAQVHPSHPSIHTSCDTHPKR